VPYYSFRVQSPSEVVLRNRHLVIGKGTDVFTLTLEDVRDFTEQLREKGVEVLEVNRLDNLQPIPVEADVQAAITGQTSFPLSLPLPDDSE
jgi:hypothetical protein